MCVIQAQSGLNYEHKTIIKALQVDIDLISGATISVYAITADVEAETRLLNEI